MTTLELKKLIREEAKKIIAENKIKSNKLGEDSMQVALKRTIRESAKKKAVARKRRLNEITVNPDPNKKMSGSNKWNFDAFAKECPVVLTSDYEGDWMEENPNWDEDFIPLQNYLYANYVDGVDFGLMIGMGDDIFNALAIKNPKILQDPTVKKYVKKAMSYGGLEFEKGSM